MRKWNIYFTIRGPGGTIESPINANPIESGSMSELLSGLSISELQYDLEVVGLRIEELL